MRIDEAVDTLSRNLDQEISRTDGHALESLEELRLLLKVWLKPEVLDSLLSLYKELNKEPVTSEAYTWFLKNSEFGGECKYAKAYIEKFRRDRLDRTVELLEVCLKKIKEM